MPCVVHLSLFGNERASEPIAGVADVGVGTKRANETDSRSSSITIELVRLFFPPLLFFPPRGLPLAPSCCTHVADKPAPRESMLHKPPILRRAAAESVLGGFANRPLSFSLFAQTPRVSPGPSQPAADSNLADDRDLTLAHVPAPTTSTSRGGPSSLINFF